MTRTATDYSAELGRNHFKLPELMSPSRQRSYSPTRGPALLCALLHLNFILLYVALITIASHHSEHGLNFLLTPSSQVTFSLIVSIVAQTFGTLYLAGLVLVTQRLALIRDLHVRQTLTAIHDKSSAWLGLGSALAALVDQVTIPSAPLGILFIATYLSGLAVLHIAIPASFSVDVFNGTTTITENSQSARADQLYLDRSVYDILSVYGQFPAIGLLENVIYDIVPVVPSAIGDTYVDATTFIVECGILSKAVQTGFERTAQDDNLWTFDIGTEDIVYSVDFPLPRPNSILIASVYAERIYTVSSNDPKTIAVATTVPVLDSSGAATSLIPINPRVTIPDNFDRTSILATVPSLQIFSCNIASQNLTMDVSAESRVPVLPIAPKSKRLWSDWAESPPSSLLDPLLQGIGQIAVNSPASSHLDTGLSTVVLVNVTDANSTKEGESYDTSIAYYAPSILERFVMEDVGLVTENATSIALSDLERAVEKAIAAIAWYGRNRNQSSPYTDHLDDAATQPELKGRAVIQVNTLRMRLHFNIGPLVVGLTVSCLLSGLASSLIFRRAKGLKYDLDKPGVLQLTWLLGNDEHFVNMQRPQADELRRAGMYNVQMSDWMRRSAYYPSVANENSYELGKWKM